MSFFGKIFGTAVEKPIEALGNAVDKIFTSDEERLKAQAIIKEIEQHRDILQVELNKLDAVNPHLLNSGWRPFIGWMCGISLGCYFIPQALFTNLMWVIMCFKAGGLVPLPIMSSQLYDLLLALLGLATLRTAEKFKGKA